jgi:hypothetical protein
VKKGVLMELEQRIAHLERRNRILAALLGLCGVVVIGNVVALVTHARAVPQEVVTHSIRVVGQGGKNEAALAATPDGFVILSFTDLKDSLRFGALMTPSGKVSLSWFGGRGPRETIGVIDSAEGEEFSLALHDRDGRTIWRPPVSNPF